MSAQSLTLYCEYHYQQPQQQQQEHERTGPLACLLYLVVMRLPTSKDMGNGSLPADR